MQTSKREAHRRYALLNAFWLLAGPLLSQTLPHASILDPSLRRGDTVHIKIENGSASAKSILVELARAGDVTYLEASYDPPEAGKAADVVSAVIPESAGLGTYHVDIDLDGHKVKAGQLSIQPPDALPVHLTSLSPTATYKTEPVYVPDPRDRTGVDIPVSNYEIDGGRAQLPGITVQWKNAEYTPILNGCTSPWPLGSKSNPVEQPTHFFAKALEKGTAEKAEKSGNGTLILCDLPTDAQIAKNGTEIEAKPLGSSREMWIRKPARSIEQLTFRVSLHGSGFQVSHPRDNAIWIDGVRQNVDWGTCSNDTARGDRQNPVPLRIQGEVVSSEDIELCSVAVPSDGQLRMATGYGGVRSESLLFRTYSMGTAGVAFWSAVISLLLALLPLLLLSSIQESYRIAGSTYKLRMLFLDPETDTYSLSKLQFYLWTVASLFAYSYLVISRIHVQFATWPDVPSTLPGIIAVAAGTAVGAQLITSSKGSKGAGGESPSFADFITSGGVVAADRVQMLLWTLLGVGTFLYAVLQIAPGNITDLPAVPERLLVLMGLSSAGYLGGKIARKAGPVIDEISVGPPDPDDVLAAAAASRAGEIPDLIEAVVTAQSRLALLAPVADPEAQAAKDALGAAISKAGAAHTVSDYNQLITDLSVQASAAEAAASRAAAAFSESKATQADAAAAQWAAAGLQDLLADITQAISLAAAAPMQAEVAPAVVPRTIEIRGSNLSADAILELDHTDLPFRMLLNAQGISAPEMVLRDVTTPTFARLLHLTIDPNRLATADLVQLRRWFGQSGRHTLTLTNPDGQKAELSFDLPPGAAQKVSSAS
jgi:hypothetical protein